MKKFIAAFLLSFFTFFLSAWDKFDENTIRRELEKPDVKLVAVEFYATWCEPCNAAIPKWKKLQEKYGDKGLELIVVSVQSKGSCSHPQWNPDKMVCDYDGKIAEEWAASEVPQAFLWNWQGNLLVAHGTVEDVEQAVEEYFISIPRVLVEEGEDSELYRLVRSELVKSSKIEVVANEAERAVLAELRKQSQQMNFDSKMRCRLGEEISANSRLVISKSNIDSREMLVLELFSVEKGCLTASGSAQIEGDAVKAVAAAVNDLLGSLLGKVDDPRKKGRHGIRSSLPRQEIVVKFNSYPTGAAVIVDGKMLCQATPCSKILTEGPHKIEMQKEQYLPVTMKERISKGKSISYDLEPDFAMLSVKGRYTVMLKLDGEEIGSLPVINRAISSGTHIVSHSDRCYRETESKISAKRGEKIVIDMNLEPKSVPLKVHVKDDADNDVEAEVFIDGKYYGTAPATFDVPLCSDMLSVKYDGKDYSEMLYLSGEAETTEVRVKSKAAAGDQGIDSDEDEDDEPDNKDEAEKEEYASRYESKRRSEPIYSYPTRRNGITLITIGAAVAAGGFGGMYYLAEKEYSDYNKMVDNAYSVAASGASRLDYKKRAADKLENAKLYRIFAISSAAVGGVMIIGGICLAARKVEVGRRHALNDVSVSFDKDSFYAELGFSF